ncbi:MAG: protoheme IX farnesyltransferase [Candidatus Sericytochromatia bacterium]|uniref:Protoheme IX farnesyltransferase n=1 Tax=Candidatus Tanganyikabacteria bacterium TaxID=2961651 RepID=A0A937X3T2_9BACT|nr:protoheme IX farnesyltransferase [Candidatus Tanganyikabacteria bacterium]
MAHSSLLAVIALARDYLALTKPTILLLVLLTGLPALILASGGRVDWPLAAVTLAGTALASASAAALNHYMDRDIDAIMRRTRGRPLPAGRLDPRRALWFGLALGALSTLVLAVWTTPLATGLAVGSILYYTVFYTGWLKRATPQNIVIGGAAGASAPLIAWAAVTGTVGLPAWIMFLVVFLWTPPHFWALALYRSDDYAAAGVPMLPVVSGPAETKRQILWYTVVLVPATLSLAALGYAGPVYAVAAAALGACFIVRAVAVVRNESVSNCMKLFGYSIAYLLVLFAVLTLDVGLRLV